MSDPSPHGPTYHLPVYPADAFRVVSGVNEGDGLGFAEDLVLDDIYKLAGTAPAQEIAARFTDRAAQVTLRHAGDAQGASGLHIDCAITLMGGAAHTTEALVLVQLDPAGHAAAVFIAPLGPLKTGVDYHLIGIDRHRPADKLVHLACVSFAAGTRVTLACGTQRPVEDLSPGDAVLTRDDGIQHIRRVGQTTQRAQGALAPVCIAAGALNNAHGFALSHEHRLFRYRRPGGLGAGREEAMVKACDLVNGSSVRVQEGGFVEYFQVFFDTRQIVFAEGIAAETMHGTALAGPTSAAPDAATMISFPSPSPSTRGGAIAH